MAALDGQHPGGLQLLQALRAEQIEPVPELALFEKAPAQKMDFDAVWKLFTFRRSKILNFRDFRDTASVFSFHLTFPGSLCRLAQRVGLLSLLQTGEHP